jgi:hypothetical protein
MTKKQLEKRGSFAALVLIACFLSLRSSDASPAFVSAPGTTSQTWSIGGPGGPLWNNNTGILEARNPSNSGYIVARGATPLSANDLTTKNYVDTNLPTPYNVRSPACGAVGDGITDDTAAIQTCVGLAQSAGGGVVFFPAPASTYKVTAPIIISDPYISLIGAEGLGSVYNPVLTQYTYGDTIFQFNSAHSVLQNLSGQYGPTTTLSSSASAGATSIVLTSATGINVNDWLILDQPNPSLQSIAPMEQCQVSGLVGSTASLSTCSVTFAPGPGYSPPITQSSTIFAHASGSWVRDQAVVSGNSVAGQPPRNYSGLASFTTGDECLVQNFGVLAMVTGVFFRGIPANNATNNYFSAVDRGHFEFTQFGTLAQQQTSFKVSNVIYANATEGQTTAPGHGLYMTGLIGFAGEWLIGKAYNQYDQVAYGAALSGTATVTAGSAAVTFSSAQTLTTSQWLTFSSQSGNAYFLTANCSGCTSATLTQAYTGANSTSATLNLNVEQYIAITGNTGNEPDISPSFWSAQTYPSAQTGWRSLNRDVQISNYYASPGATFKDWSGLKVKFTDGMAITNAVFENSVRGFDWQECANCTSTGAIMRNFVPPISTDSAAAAMTLLDCNEVNITGASINLTQDSQYGDVGGPIDMPGVFDRVDGTQDPITGTPLGHDNTFANITLVTNYDTLFTSQAFRTQAIRDHFVHDYLNENGGHNPPAFGLTFNGTSDTWPTGSMVIRPTVIGTTNALFYPGGAPTNAGFVFDCDPNQLPTGFSFTDQGSGTLLTNCYLTNNEGLLGLSPQSTSADVFDFSLQAGASQKILNVKDSAGNGQFVVTNAGGSVKVEAESSTASSNAFVCGGLNATGGYATSGQTLLGFAPVDNGGTCGNAAALFSATASENHSISAQGTDWRIYTVSPGVTTQYKNVHIYGTGDVSTNDTGGALATTATAGFTFLPSMAGVPTGSVSGHTGTVGFAYDTVDDIFWVNTSSTNWRASNAYLNAASGPVSGTAFTCNSFQRVGAAQTGASYTIPTASTCPGSEVQIKCTNGGAPYSYTITPVSGTVDGSSSYLFSCNSELAAVTFVSDGTNWWSEQQHVNVSHASGSLPLANLAQGGATTGQTIEWNGSTWAPVTGPYVEDSPSYHSLDEWNGQPAYATQTSTPTSGTPTISRITAQTSDTISNVWFNISTLGATLTAATTTSVTGATSSAGLIELTVTSTASFATNNVVSIAGVTGTTEANNCWLITVVDGTHLTLQNSVFVNAYVSGGTVTRSANAIAIYSSSGTLLECTGDQVATWTGSTGAKEMTLAGTMTLSANSGYFITILSTGTTPPTLRGFQNNAGTQNVNLNGASLRWGTNGSALTSLPSSITPASNGTTNLVTWWGAFN